MATAPVHLCTSRSSLTGNRANCTAHDRLCACISYRQLWREEEDVRRQNSGMSSGAWKEQPRSHISRSPVRRFGVSRRGALVGRRRPMHINPPSSTSSQAVTPLLQEVREYDSLCSMYLAAGLLVCWSEGRPSLHRFKVKKKARCIWRRIAKYVIKLPKDLCRRRPLSDVP